MGGGDDKYMDNKEKTGCQMKTSTAGFLYGKSFSIIYRHGKTMHEKMLKEFDLSGPQIWYLKEIHENPGISQEDISQGYHIDKGSVSRAVKKLSDSGFVNIEANPDDKRAYRLFLTDKAQDTYRSCIRHMQYMEKCIEKGMSEEEIRTFRRLLIKVASNIAMFAKEEKGI